MRTNTIALPFNKLAPVDFVMHDRLKELSHQARGVIRTGEATPFANVILYSGVIF